MSDYYRVIKKGEVYACIACGLIYDDWSARLSATNCCADKKPFSQYGLKQAQAVLKQSYHHPTPRTAQRGDGTRHKDRWGHWHRGKQLTDNSLKAQVNRAWQAHQQEQRNKEIVHLERLCPTYEIDTRPYSRTPLQRLCTAFHYGAGWERIKALAYALATDQVIKERVSQYDNELRLDSLFKNKE